MNEIKDIMLVSITQDKNNITLDDIFMVTTDISELRLFIETALEMHKTRYLNHTGAEAVAEFKKEWKKITTESSDVRHICSEMTDSLSHIHIQVWQDGEIRGGRLYA